MLLVYAYTQTGVRSQIPAPSEDHGALKKVSCYAKFKARVFKKEQLTPQQQAASEMRRLYGRHLRRRGLEIFTLALGIAPLTMGIIGALGLLPIGAVGSYALVAAGGYLLLDGSSALLVDFGRLKLTQRKYRGTRLCTEPTTYTDSQGNVFTQFYAIDASTARPPVSRSGAYDKDAIPKVNTKDKTVTFSSDASDATIYYHTVFFPSDEILPNYNYTIVRADANEAI